jgi:SpoVK/Ycf46/Vps4 family AAA+-type ATPase
MPTVSEGPTSWIESISNKLPQASQSDLVVPENTRRQLSEITARARYPAVSDWARLGMPAPDLGNSFVLFVGPTGTGKTLAARVLAGELGLDLWRIDLAEVRSKYIGETEKQLDRIFGAAESSNAVLLLDEADALFGKRSSPRDAHDRYATLNIAYLLQRLERHSGLVILTSNMQDNLDPSFVRRARYVVEFVRPDLEHRSVIWRQVLPPEAVLAPDVDFARLAQVSLTGGEIRSIAERSALKAQALVLPITMESLLQSTREELSRLGRSTQDVGV